MKQFLKLYIFLFFVLFSFILNGQSDKTILQHFILTNGMEVYINEDHSSPRVFGAVIVHVGAKHDPKDATGMAHYFEHIMFKGTDKIGTVDFESEKIYLDQIAAKYDELAKTTDVNERKQIQTEINELSVKAAEFAIPNEIDNLLASVGGNAVNAGTGFDQTVYYNAFPPSHIEHWLEIYSERFRNPVFRLFQSELETVYEEKNRSEDDMFQKLFFDVFLKNVFKKHQYGQQSMIGTTEHLKNPSITKMQEFFDTYYVANNMALLLAGDVDAKTILPLIEEKFGKLRRGIVPQFEVAEEEPFNKEVVTVKATPIPMEMITYRTVASNHKDEIPLEICLQLLWNGTTGFLDKVVMNNDLMMVQPIPMTLNDYGVMGFMVVPKLIGQSFEAAEKIFFEAINRLKIGDFEEETLQAITRSMEKELLFELEDLNNRYELMLDVIGAKTPWEQVLKTPQRIASITKEDIVDVANRYYGSDNCMILHSKIGKLSADKIEKPNFKPIIAKNSEAKSEYYKMVQQIPETQIPPKFVDFTNDVTFLNIQEKVRLAAVKNTENQIFTLKIVFRVSESENPKAKYTADYLNLIGTENQDFATFRKKLQSLATDVEIYQNETGFCVSISGYDEDFEESIKLVYDLLTQPKADDKQLKKLADDAITSYKETIRTPAIMGSAALREFVLYGKRSSYLTGLPLIQIKKLTSKELFVNLKEILAFAADLEYCGGLTAEKVKEIMLKQNLFSTNPKPAQTPYFREIQQYNKPTVFYVKNKSSIQSQINVLGNSEAANDHERAVSIAFNEYFGVGMSSIVFQEIREFRSLAYGASARYLSNSYLFRDKPAYFMGWLQTQADKTAEALEVMTDLFQNMPEKPDRLDIIKRNYVQSINTFTPSMRNLASTVMLWKSNGYNEDPRKEQVSTIEHLQFEDILSFYQKFIQKKPLIYTVYGSLNKTNYKSVKQLGTIIEIDSKKLILK